MSDASIPPHIPEWIRDHLGRYLESDGADGYFWDSTFAGGPGPLATLLLTTTGRKSGKTRVLPLLFGETNGGYAIVASKGGAPSHPAWYLNLVTEPDVEVQIKDKRFKARARTATGDERAALWEQMAGIYPPYADYQKKTSREIPVVVLEPTQP